MFQSPAQPSRDFFLNNTKLKNYNFHKFKKYPTGSFWNGTGSNYWRNSRQVLLALMFYRQQTLLGTLLWVLCSSGQATDAHSEPSAGMIEHSCSSPITTAAHTVSSVRAEMVLPHQQLSAAPFCRHSLGYYHVFLPLEVFSFPLTLIGPHSTKLLFSPDEILKYSLDHNAGSRISLHLISCVQVASAVPGISFPSRLHHCPRDTHRKTLDLWRCLVLLLKTASLDMGPDKICWWR